MKGPKPTYYVGKRYPTTNCGYVEIVNITNSFNIQVRFEDGTLVTVPNSRLFDGKIKNPNYPSLCSVGILGQGFYNTKDHKTAYIKWSSMIKRCYHYEYASYSDCFVSEDFTNFQNFAAWFYNQKAHTQTSWALDKDLIEQENREYSAEKCVLLPPELNTIFKRACKENSVSRGIKITKSGRFESSVSRGLQGKIVKLFDDLDSARKFYKENKEAYVKSITEKYRDYLEDSAYIKLTNYIVVT